MSSQSHSQRRWVSGSRRKSAASMTGGRSSSWSRRSACCRSPMSSGSHDSRDFTYDATTSAGSRISSTLRNCRAQVEVLPGREVVGHVLGVVDADAVGEWGQQSGDHLVDVGRLRGDDLVARRVVEPGPGQERGIERLVRDDRVGPVLPGAHHRGRDVAGARPHGHPDRHGAVRPATSAATCSAYSDWRRSTTGPRWPVPMVRPSTVRTGTTPAKVPVTNASLAE